jgi:hypothetical protein
MSNRFEWIENQYIELSSASESVMREANNHVVLTVEDGLNLLIKDDKANDHEADID